MGSPLSCKIIGGETMSDDGPSELDHRIAISEQAKGLKNGILVKMKEMVDKDPEKFSKVLKTLIMSGQTGPSE